MEEAATAASRAPPLSDFVALSTMDDWLTFVFVECCQPTFPPLMPMKMALECGINLRLLAQPLPAGRRQIGHLVRDACANLRDQIGRIASASARNALTVRTAIRLLARLLLLALTLDPASREAPPLGERDLALISAYLAKVHSKQLRCKSALSSPAGPRELCIFPDGFTDLHVRTLIRLDARCTPGVPRRRAPPSHT